MSEYFIAVNLTRNEYIDPNEFSDTIDVSSKVFRYATAVTHIDWCVGHSTWILPYLLAESANTEMWRRVYGEYFGSWSADNVMLVGDTTNMYSVIIEEWRDISQNVFLEVKQSNTDILCTK